MFSPTWMHAWIRIFKWKPCSMQTNNHIFLLNKMIGYNNTHGTLYDIHISWCFSNSNGSTKMQRGFFIDKITFLDIASICRPWKLFKITIFISSTIFLVYNSCSYEYSTIKINVRWLMKRQYPWSLTIMT